MHRVGKLASGKFVSAKSVPEVLKRIIEPGDNQKQADFLANQLATLTKKDLRDIHLVMSCLTLVRQSTGPGGARAEAARGFPRIFETGIPVYQDALASGLACNAACIQTLFALMESAWF